MPQLMKVVYADVLSLAPRLRLSDDTPCTTLAGSLSGVITTSTYVTLIVLDVKRRLRTVKTQYQYYCIRMFNMLRTVYYSHDC